MTNPASLPQISVVMGVHNDEAYLPAALDGILEQQGVDFELIVVNDGSTDGSRGDLWPSTSSAMRGCV